MTHNEVFKWFELYFELFAGDRVAVWFPNGKNSIRIRQKNGAEFIFTFNSHKDWKFETMDSFMKRKTKEGNTYQFTRRGTRQGDRGA